MAHTGCGADNRRTTAWTIPEIAERLQVDRDTVSAWVRSGQLPAIDITKAASKKPRWRITSEAFSGFLQARSNVKPAVDIKARAKRAPKRPAGWVDYF